MDYVQVQANLNTLTSDERLRLIQGISLEAAQILKKVMPDNIFVDMLIQYKIGAGV